MRKALLLNLMICGIKALKKPRSKLPDGQIKYKMCGRGSSSGNYIWVSNLRCNSVWDWPRFLGDKGILSILPPFIILTKPWQHLSNSVNPSFAQPRTLLYCTQIIHNILCNHLVQFPRYGDSRAFTQCACLEKTGESVDSENISSSSWDISHIC